MYEQFYGLRENPFALAPNPAYLYLSPQHQYALTMLEYAIWQAAGFAVITGEVGCGKTTVVQHFLGDRRERLTVALISNVHPGMGPLLPLILASLGVQSRESRADEHQQLLVFLRQKHAAGERVVFVIDEAQNLSVEALEELRVLSNVNAGKDLLLQTFLIGQPELRATLSLPQLRQFAQRIVVDSHLTPLAREETHAYIAYRLAVAGGGPDLISPDAVERIHDCAGGVPRLVNILCDTALVYGFAEQRQAVNIELVEQVLADKAGSVLPLKRSRRAAAESVLGS